MPISAGVSLLIILIVAVTTFATRVVPFLIFPKGKEIPDVVKYLGKVLTPAVIGMLVVYCLRSTPVRAYPHGLPELIASAVVVILHVWKRNNLLSIGVGTVLYMFLVQVVFS
jgi:branched-subunit amino acid transport protein AzlD